MKKIKKLSVFLLIMTMTFNLFAVQVSAAGKGEQLFNQATSEITQRSATINWIYKLNDEEGTETKEASYFIISLEGGGSTIDVTYNEDGTYDENGDYSRYENVTSLEPGTDYKVYVTAYNSDDVAVETSNENNRWDEFRTLDRSKYLVTTNNVLTGVSGLVEEFIEAETTRELNYIGEDNDYEEIPDSMTWRVDPESGDMSDVTTRTESDGSLTITSLSSNVVIEAVYLPREYLTASSDYPRIVLKNPTFIIEDPFDYITDYTFTGMNLRTNSEMVFDQSSRGNAEVDVQLGNPVGGSLEWVEEQKFGNTDNPPSGFVKATADADYQFLGFDYFVYLNLDDNNDNNDFGDPELEKIGKLPEGAGPDFEINVKEESTAELMLSVSRLVSYDVAAHFEAEYIVYVTARFEAIVPQAPDEEVTPTSTPTSTSTSNPTQYTLIVNVIGEGSVPGFQGTNTFSSGTNVNLNAVLDADSDQVFEGWIGDVTSADTAVVLVLDGNKEVTAVFGDIPEEVIPQANPVEEILDAPEPVPEAAPVDEIPNEDLPQTGGIPMSAMTLIGFALSGIGIKLRKRS